LLYVSLFGLYHFHEMCLASRLGLNRTFIDRNEAGKNFLKR
jgi:hypothetical protein